MSTGKNIIVSTVKAAVGMVPVAGPFISEFISLAQDNVMNRRQAEWKTLVEAKLSRLQNRLDELASDEFFVSVVQKTSSYAMQAYQAEKRALFANILYNAASVNIDQDKQLLFINLLEQYTMLEIKLLDFLSVDRYNENDYVKQSGMVKSYTYPSEERFLDFLAKADQDFSDRNYMMNLCRQLMRDGLIEEIDFGMPQRPNYTRKKRTTTLGEAFLAYIRDQK